MRVDERIPIHESGAVGCPEIGGSELRRILGDYGLGIACPLALSFLFHLCLLLRLFQSSQVKDHPALQTMPLGGFYYTADLQSMTQDLCVRCNAVDKEVSPLNNSNTIPLLGLFNIYPNQSHSALSRGNFSIKIVERFKPLPINFRLNSIPSTRSSIPLLIYRAIGSLDRIESPLSGYSTIVLSKSSTS